MVHKVPSQEAKRQHPCQTLAGTWRAAPVKHELFFFLLFRAVTPGHHVQWHGYDGLDLQASDESDLLVIVFCAG